MEYPHTARVRRDLVDRYAPATVNNQPSSPSASVEHSDEV